MWSVRCIPPPEVEDEDEEGKLSNNWMPFLGAEVGKERKRFVKGALEGREDVRIRRSVRRLDDS